MDDPIEQKISTNDQTSLGRFPPVPPVSSKITGPFHEFQIDARYERMKPENLALVLT